MAGTKAGGLKTREKNLAKDPNYYANMGRIGGKKSSTGGFASDVIGEDGLTGKQRARIAGAKGGTISRRGSKKTTEVIEPKPKSVWQRIFAN